MMESLLPLVGGGIFGAVVKLFSMSMQAKADERLGMIQALNAKRGAIADVNDMALKSSRFAVTRQVIALSVTAAIVGLVFWPSDPVNVQQAHEVGSSWLWGLIDTRKQVVEWVQLNGSVVLPDLLPSFKAIVGAYFGASMATGR